MSDLKMKFLIDGSEKYQYLSKDFIESYIKKDGEEGKIKNLPDDFVFTDEMMELIGMFTENRTYSPPSNCPPKEFIRYDVGNKPWIMRVYIMDELFGVERTYGSLKSQLEFFKG